MALIISHINLIITFLSQFGPVCGDHLDYRSLDLFQILWVVSEVILGGGEHLVVELVRVLAAYDGISKEGQLQCLTK